jgi:hypothetical protein
MEQSDNRADALNPQELVQDRNNRYLSASLEWLKLRLHRLTGPAAIPARAIPARSPVSQAPTLVETLFSAPGGTKGATAQPPALPAPTGEVSDEAVAQAEQRMLEFEALNPSPALVLLAQRFGLTRFERNVLLLCVAVEIDPDIARDCARIQGDPQNPFPTFAVAMALFDEPHWDAMSPERPLRYWPMIEMNQPGVQALTTSPLRADERILNFIKGLNYLDDRLFPLMAPLDSYDGELPPSQQAAVDFILSIVDQSLPLQALPIIQLLGGDPTSKRLVAQRAAADLGMQTYRLSAEMLPAHAGELDTLTRLWRRESALLPLVLYLEAPGLERGEHSEELASRLSRFLNRSAGLCFLDTRENWPGLSHRSYTVEVQKPLPVEQAAIWSTALGTLAGDNPRPLSTQFNLNLVMIRTIAARALTEETSGSTVTAQEGILAAEGHLSVEEAQKQQRLGARLWQACLDSTRPQLEALSQRIDTRATWDDIVLPAQEEALLHEIAGQVGVRSRVYDEWGFREKMNRGLGISALFAGPSGTGKTMAAEVIANDLGLYLYRIDLSAVVSKYIGETEKNLRRLFDAAEDSGAILFFDEADALFGKRSEVKDSHDRYANIEINYLLQRMEAYRGLAILATNMKSALDTAFLRRLRFIVNFPFPAAEQRREIWRKAFPKDVPLANDEWGRLDYDRLSQLNLTGGSIHNIVLNAAFLAARQTQEPRELTMEFVLRAAQNEFRKLGMTVNAADFRLPPKPASVPEPNHGVTL